jgi:uncharacterized protein
MRQDVLTTKLSTVETSKLSRPPIKSRAFRATRTGPTNRHWVRGDPFATAFFNALSAVFPQGEAFMIRSLASFQHSVPAPLGIDIKSFIEQEAGHSREHVAMNKGLIAAGYDVEPLDRAIRKFVAVFRDTSDLTKVAATMCIEHITAIVAAEVLKNDHHLAGSDPELKELWLWHAIEEVEHKAVAFDTWMYLTRDWSSIRRWATRSSFMVILSASFLYNRTRGQVELLRQDGFNVRDSLRGVIISGFARGGIGRNLMKPWAHFLKPGFHPWQIDDSALIVLGEEKLKQASAVNSGKQAANVTTERRTRTRLAAAA